MIEGTLKNVTSPLRLNLNSCWIIQRIFARKSTWTVSFTRVERNLRLRPQVNPAFRDDQKTKGKARELPVLSFARSYNNSRIYGLGVNSHSVVIIKNNIYCLYNSVCFCCLISRLLVKYWRKIISAKLQHGFFGAASFCSFVFFGVRRGEMKLQVGLDRGVNFTPDFLNVN